jgi:hypothetical protein
VVRRAVAEGLGTGFLLAAVVGSGIMGERLAGGNVAIALLANTMATGAMLVALILTFGPISGGAPESGGDAGGRFPGWGGVARSAGVCCGTGGGWVRRSGGGSLDVWRAGIFRVAARAGGECADV